MSAPQDKTFSTGTACPQGGESFYPGTPDPVPPYVPPAPGAVDLEANFPNPLGRYQTEPDESVARDLVVNQFLNQQAIVFKAMGEEMLVYRQKKFGQPCACVDANTNQAQDGCRVCFGTRFVGGYDMIGKTAGYIGPNPLTRKLMEMGIALSQKPALYLLPDMVIRDRDFILAKARNPSTDLMRFQAEPVVRGGGDIDALSKLNARSVIKISLTQDGVALNPQPGAGADADLVGNYAPVPKAGGAASFTENLDFVLTGGELTVENALTVPPNADTRILRVLGKRAPLFPPDSESPSGETDSVAVLLPTGLSAGLAAKAFNRAAQPQAFSTTLTVGTGADAGFFLITLAGATGSNLSNQTTFPAAQFLVTIVGSGILWLTLNRPAPGATYYVTYEAAINVTRRYQVLNVTANHYQGVCLAQEAEIDLLDQTHPIHGVNSIYDQGAPIDRQPGDLNVQRKAQGQAAGLVTDAQNNADPRFVNPGDFL